MEKPRLQVPPERPHSAFSKDHSDLVSYEDLLVAQYLEDMKKSRQELKKFKETPLSPYSQKFATTVGYRNVRRRPVSASIVGRSRLTGKPKIDLKYIADPSLWDAATPRSDKLRLLRPSSAPIKQRKRPQSATSSIYSYSGRQSRPPSGRTKPLYKKQPHIIRVTAYKNGCKDTSVRGAASSIKVLLEHLTEKLGLPFAARRIFLEDGIEVFDGCDIPSYSEVFISMGEPYKDPDENAKRNMIQRNGTTWTLKGVNLPSEGKKKTTKPRISKRLKSLIDKKKVRIIVYKNGNGNEAGEVIADMDDIQSFLDCCTCRLNLTSHARHLFDWDGNEVTDLNDTPMLDECLQSGITPAFGPLWISTGEGFSPSGSRDYIIQIIQFLRKKLKEAKEVKTDIDNALDDETDKVNNKTIKSMSATELYEYKTKIESDIDVYKENLSMFRQKYESLNEKHEQEESYGAVYRMTHIKEIPADSRLVGKKGLRLKVYENGQSEGEHIFFFNLREALKGINNNKDMLMKRLLDELSSSHWTNNTQAPKLNAIAQKIYDKFGHEITDVMKLEYDQEIWLSFGEAFITPFIYCVAATFDRACKVEKEGVDHVIRQQITQEDLTGREDHKQWESTIGFPILFEPDPQSMFTNVDTNPWMLENAEIDSRGDFLIHKKKRDLVLYPEIAADEKLKRGQKDHQIWLVSKSGYIYSKYMPQMCLGVSETRIEGKLFSKDVPIEGPVVTLQKRQAENPSQMWIFNPDGTISPQSHGEQRLTYIGSILGDDESYHDKKPTGHLSGFKACLVICDAMDSKKDNSSQRFAIKQEKFENLGQWKFTEANNVEFTKLAYSWPVKENGDLNDKYDWPMEGFIIPNAPHVKKSSRKMYSPLKLMVLKNGERDITSAVPVVATDMTNYNLNHQKEKPRSRRQRENEDDAMNSNYIILHTCDSSVHNLQFILFLNSATTLLDLPFAARRLFDDKGEEHFDLNTLDRDQIVYVSCGEQWVDPKFTKEEQQRRHLLSQLAHDVTKIEQFCALRNPEKFVLEIRNNLTPNSPVAINKEFHKDDDLRVSVSQSVEEKQEEPQPQQEEEKPTQEDLSLMTPRQRAHLKSEERLNSLKWPWERIVNANASFDYSDPEATKYTDKELYEKYKPKPSPRLSRDVLQTFTYEDGFIACSSNRHLVLGVNDQECHVNEVFLMKRTPDDINQKWEMTPDGEIHSKFKHNMILTVSMPCIETRGGKQSLTFGGCAVTLQKRLTHQFGKAFQKWHYDAESGLIRAFHTELPDKEITAANQADVCTFAIAHSVEIDQPGYCVEIPSSYNVSNVTHIKVCISCARAMRGRYKLTKLKPRTPFSCAMGTAKKLRLKQIGSFRILNGKVDLSTHEAEVTLKHWREKLESMRKKTNASVISKEISATKAVKNVKVLAYKNGEGRLRSGEIICGSSIQGLLNQCMKRLGLNNSARRLYTEDGLIMLDIEDLIDYAVENYKNSTVDKLEKIMNGENDKDEDTKEVDVAEGEPTESQMRLQRAMQYIEENEDDERGDNERGESDPLPDNEADDTQEITDAQHLHAKQTEVDDKEAEKIKRHREHLLSQIKLPPLEVILRYPIEVWVSSGKAFVPPEVVESKEVNRKKRRAFRAQVSLELDIEKHVLRQLKGRRVESQKPGEYRSTLCSKQPVIKEGNWEQPTVEEKVKHGVVNKLETHLNEIRANQKSGSVTTLNVQTTRKLYQPPAMIRVLAYPNGEGTDRAAYIYGENMTQLLENATLKLNLWKKAKIIFDENGKQVKDFTDITRDQLLCISTGNKYKKPQASNKDIEVKANWGRARKMYGAEATDLRVYASKNGQVNVDPFGPPGLALPLPITITENETHSKPGV